MKTTPLVHPANRQQSRLDAAVPLIDTFAGMVITDRAAREEILHRAYAIWECEGHPENRKLDNWLEAEGQIFPPGGEFATAAGSIRKP